MAKSTQKLPTSVTLARAYGYIHTDNSRRFWDAGRVVVDAKEIEDLLERKAPLVEII